MASRKHRLYFDSLNNHVSSSVCPTGGSWRRTSRLPFRLCLLTTSTSSCRTKKNWTLSKSTRIKETLSLCTCCTGTPCSSSWRNSCILQVRTIDFYYYDCCWNLVIVFFIYLFFMFFSVHALAISWPVTCLHNMASSGAEINWWSRWAFLVMCVSEYVCVRGYMLSLHSEQTWCCRE